MPRSGAQETLASCPSTPEEAFCPPPPPGLWPNLRDHGWASCVALDTGCPFLPKGHSSYWALYKFLLNIPGAPGQWEELVLHTRQGGARAGYRRGWRPSSEPPPGRPQLGHGSMQGRVG